MSEGMNLCQLNETILKKKKPLYRIDNILSRSIGLQRRSQAQLKPAGWIHTIYPFQKSWCALRANDTISYAPSRSAGLNIVCRDPMKIVCWSWKSTITMYAGLYHFYKAKLEYAAFIWYPLLSNLINGIESIQNCAARFIFFDFSHHTRVTLLGLNADLQSLCVRRKIARSSLIHKMYCHNRVLKYSLFNSPHYTWARQITLAKYVKQHVLLFLFRTLLAHLKLKIGTHYQITWSQKQIVINFTLC